MRQPARDRKRKRYYCASFLVCVLALALLAAPAKAAEEYFTEEELDLIRAAQELRRRIPVYLKLAESRLKFLGVMQKTDKELDRERKERERREKELKNAEQKKNGPAAAQKPPIDELAYLDQFTSDELLRGYIQVLDEVHTNIDDAYSRRLDVREALEDLDKFTRETLPLLQKYKPRNSADRAAMEDAVDKAKQSQVDTKEALKIVPKTEKKRQQP